MLKGLHCLPIHKRIIFKILLLTYKSLNDCAPSHQTTNKILLHIKQPARSLRSSSDTLNLIRPVPKLKTYDQWPNVLSLFVLQNYGTISHLISENLHLLLSSNPNSNTTSSYLIKNYNIHMYMCMYSHVCLCVCMCVHVCIYLCLYIIYTSVSL